MSAAEELVERTAVTRGLPRAVTDPTVLARVAALVAPINEKAAPVVVISGTAKEVRRATGEQPRAA